MAEITIKLPSYMEQKLLSALLTNTFSLYLVPEISNEGRKAKINNKIDNIDNL